MITIDDLRRFAVARSLFPLTTLKRALHRLGFVQADPIRAPARAQDLMLRHRVKDYRAGDLERQYTKLGIEEDFFVVYGFLTRSLQALMHPRSDTGVPAEGPQPWSRARRKQAQLLLEFVHKHGAVHPREVDRHFSHGKVTNYWGGSSNATTHLLDAMHYRGMLRVARREKGIRIYGSRKEKRWTIIPSDVSAKMLLELAIEAYAPLPSTSLGPLASHLGYAAPQLRAHLRAALKQLRNELPHAH